MITLSRKLELSTPCMKGEDVSALQTALVHRGYEIEIDGIFGPLTQWAVEKFQSSVRLPVTGVAEQATQQILHARELYLSDPYLIGSDVRDIQERLVRIGYDVPVDGIYSLRTRDAVLSFQRYFHLPEDGMVQGETLSQLLFMPVMAEAV
ncbi:MAG: peptidoglycan-binding protein [Phormidesmis sp.]